jgi:hypothetical protein
MRDKSAMKKKIIQTMWARSTREVPHRRFFASRARSCHKPRRRFFASRVRSCHKPRRRFFASIARSYRKPRRRLIALVNAPTGKSTRRHLDKQPRLCFQPITSNRAVTDA